MDDAVAEAVSSALRERRWTEEFGGDRGGHAGAIVFDGELKLRGCGIGGDGVGRGGVQ